MGSTASASAPSPVSSLDQRVRAELVRTAFEDAIYGASFAAVIAVIVSATMRTAFPARVVYPWTAAMLTCNALRLLSRWAYRRRTVPLDQAGGWEKCFIAVSAAT